MTSVNHQSHGNVHLFVIYSSHVFRAPFTIHKLIFCRLVLLSIARSTLKEKRKIKFRQIPGNSMVTSTVQKRAPPGAPTKEGAVG